MTNKAKIFFIKHKILTCWIFVFIILTYICIRSLRIVKEIELKVAVVLIEILFFLLFYPFYVVDRNSAVEYKIKERKKVSEEKKRKEMENAKEAEELKQKIKELEEKLAAKTSDAVDVLVSEKICEFCGKKVDKEFIICPHCGTEF